MQMANLTTSLAMESAAFINGATQARGAIRKLVESLDPAAAAQGRFNRQVELAERGLKTGQISADLYEKVVARLRQRLDDASQGGSRFAQTSGQMRVGMQQLGYQLGDISQGFAVGTSAVTIFAQQSGQTIQALQLMSGEAKGVLGVLGGPWGAVMAAALVAVSPFVAKLFEGNDGLADQVTKLTANASKQDVAAQASRAFAGTQAGLEARIRDATAALAQQNATLRTNAELNNIRRRTDAETARAGYADAQRRLDEANKRVLQFKVPGASDARLAGARDDALAGQQAARDAVRKASLDRDNASALLNISRVYLAAEQAAAEATVSGKISKKYDDKIRLVQREAIVQAEAGKQIGTATKERIAALEAQKQAELDAAEKTTRATRAHTGHAKEVKEDAKQIKFLAEIATKASGDIDGLTKFLEGSQETLRKARAASFTSILGNNDDFDAMMKAANDGLTEQFTKERAQENDLKAQKQRNIYELSGLYMDLFQGGTSSIWQSFERLGMQIIAEQAAAWTASLATGKDGHGGLFGWIAKVAGIANPGDSKLTTVDTSSWGTSATPDYTNVGLPKFADGGSFMFGGRSGVDANVLKLNDSPIAHVTKGETGIVLPKGGGARNAQPVVVQLVVGEGQMFESRVQSISGNVAIQTVTDNNRKQAFARERSLAG